MSHWTCLLCDEQNALLTPFCSCGARRKSKIVLFLRHGEALHNLRKKEGRHGDEPKTRDPELTEKGRQQAQEIGIELKQTLCGYDVVVVSPLTRALQTAREMICDAEKKVIVSHLHCERNPQSSLSDTGTHPKELKELRCPLFVLIVCLC
jgi:broad specificity phosphatase PhoE